MSPPLDQKYVMSENPKTGKHEKIPALHPQRKQAVQFVLYQPPPLDISDEASYDEWVERCSFLEDDLHWLLKQPHDKFWCQVIFDETLHRCIDSYLNNAPRSHDVYEELPSDIKAKHDTLHRLFFLTCLRMATYKESKDCHLTPTVFGEILYENFIFDIPKVMDICVLFGAGNGPIVSKMVENIFEQQPRYKDDLLGVVPTILEVFDNIQKKCGLKVEASFSPLKLADGSGPRNALLSLPLTEFQDIIFYLADTCATLWAFLEAYPRVALAFRDQDFPIRLVTMYEALVPALTEALHSRDWHQLAIRPLLARKVRQAQRHLLLVFRHIVFRSYLQPAIEGKRPNAVEEVVEAYVHLMTLILGERRFTAHYDYLFPFVDDQDLLGQTSYAIDGMRIEFLEQGFAEAREAFGPQKRKPVPQSEPLWTSGSGTAEETWQTIREQSYEAPDHGEDYGGACAARISGVELESLITSVRDLLPYLGEGFIELALEEFGYDVERVINGVLEEKLPPSLETIDRALPRQSKVLTEDDVLSQRANVYDNDEFDVFNRKDVDMSRIHKGKKEKGLNMALLDQKAELSSIKPLYDKYGSEDRPSMYDDLTEYDDEYDDTYDDNNIGAADADSADDLRDRRPFTQPRILNTGGASRHSAQREEEQEDSDDEGYQKPRDQWIEDPAKIRERQAQRRAAKQNQQAKRPPVQQPGGPPRSDVKGKPKGQGQDANVVRNRAHKEKNKSKNRQNLADKKRKV